MSEKVIVLIYIILYMHKCMRMTIHALCVSAAEISGLSAKVQRTTLIAKYKYVII